MNIEKGLRIENENLKRFLEETERERDEALAYAYQLRVAIGFILRLPRGTSGRIIIEPEEESTLMDAASEQPCAALAALKAELQAVGAMAAWVDLKRMGMAQSGSKSVIQSLVLKLRQRAQEAGNGS